MINVLLVEDDLDHCDLIRESLNSVDLREFHVVYAHSVAEGKRLLAERDFSCVILDHSLPDGHGAELLEASKDRLRGTPVIGLSTSRDPAVAILDFRSGCVEFLQKHQVFRDGSLRERVKAVLERFKQAKASGAVESFGLANLVNQIESVVASSAAEPEHSFMAWDEFERAAAELHAQAHIKREPYTVCLIGLQSPTTKAERELSETDHARVEELMGTIVKIVRGSLSEHDLVARSSPTQVLLVRDRARVEKTLPWAHNIAEQISDSEPLRADGPGEHGTFRTYAVCIAVAGYEPLMPTPMQNLIDRVNRAVEDRVTGSRCWVVLA